MTNFAATSEICISNILYLHKTRQIKQVPLKALTVPKRCYCVLARRSLRVYHQQFLWSLGWEKGLNQKTPKVSTVDWMGFLKGELLHTGKPIRLETQHKESRAQNPEKLIHSPWKWWEGQNTQEFTGIMPVVSLNLLEVSFRPTAATKSKKKQKQMQSSIENLIGFLYDSWVRLHPI